MIKNPQHQFDIAEQKFPTLEHLGQNLLDIPLKKTKHLNQMLELQAKQSKILHQINSKSTKTHTKQSIPTLTLQKHQNSSNSSSYIVSCIMRSFSFRKLSVEDIAEIFGVKADLVEEIDKFRIVSDFQAGNHQHNTKLQAMKIDILNKVSQSFQNNPTATFSKSNLKEIKSQFPQVKRKRTSLAFSPSQNVQQQHSASKLSANRLTSRPKSQIFEHKNSISQSSEELGVIEQDMFEYQNLLRNKPPYRLDNKTVAMVQILKSRPSLTQKDMLRVLEEEYGIKDMNQASVSRLIKKIYEMKSKVEIILQAQREGLVAF